ncbi:MAG: prephenate dehydrogenase/arogenate dehydrogenase family protein [Gemmatimonadota bacterium]
MTAVDRFTTDPTPIQRVAVIGLGLMGGSLARALAARDVYVLGYDSAPDSLDAAEGEGIVHERLGALLDGVERADVVVFALPVDATLATLPRVAAKLRGARLVMDVASTKRSIVTSAHASGLGERYVGAHPLTGSHRSGWRASRATLFDDARVFLCPTEVTTPDALRLAEGFWRGLRAGVEVIDASVHDEQMAWRSHLPHVLSTALSLALRDAHIQRSALGPGGRDMTRLSGGAASMWTSIVEDNGVALVHAMDAVERQLHVLRDALSRGDTAATHAYFVRGCAWFDGEPL